MYLSVHKENTCPNSKDLFWGLADKHTKAFQTTFESFFIDTQEHLNINNSAILCNTTICQISIWPNGQCSCCYSSFQNPCGEKQTKKYYVSNQCCCACLHSAATLQKLTQIRRTLSLPLPVPNDMEYTRHWKMKKKRKKSNFRRTSPQIWPAGGGRWLIVAHSE